VAFLDLVFRPNITRIDHIHSEGYVAANSLLGGWQGSFRNCTKFSFLGKFGLPLLFSALLPTPTFNHQHYGFDLFPQQHTDSFILDRDSWIDLCSVSIDAKSKFPAFACGEQNPSPHIVSRNVIHSPKDRRHSINFLAGLHSTTRNELNILSLGSAIIV